MPTFPLVFDFTRGWRFHLGEAPRATFEATHKRRGWLDSSWLKTGNHGPSRNAYPDTDWTPVNLPHDFVAAGAFSPEAQPDRGSLPTNLGWYRKTFELPADLPDDARVYLELDGAYRDSQVWMNGQFVGRHLSGYTGFGFDLTDFLLPGRTPNTVAIRVDARLAEQWSYEGGGIYRDVRLRITGPARIAPGTVHLRDDYRPGRPIVRVRLSGEVVFAPPGTRTEAALAPSPATVEFALLDPAGHPVAQARAAHTLRPDHTKPFRLAAELPAPSPWSPASPWLYTVRITLRDAAGHALDAVTFRHGFRHARFDARRGFLLDGVPLKLLGVCNHQDHAGVGVAVPPALDRWRLLRLRELGVNALRTAHHPPSPALLDLCDELGFLVMAEARAVGPSGETLGQLEALLRQHRHHPCIILWSLGNEEMLIQEDDRGARQLRLMHAHARRLDPDRPTTYAMNCHWTREAARHDRPGRPDIFGANYVCCETGVDSAHYDRFHGKHPDWPLLASESGGTLAVRGLYRTETPTPDFPRSEGARFSPPSPDRPFLSAYADTLAYWGSELEETWRACATRPWLAGTFYWTGFDYLGEPYGADGWPFVGSNYGLLDSCGFAKDTAHYLRSQWTAAPMVHLFPHWNWAGLEGRPVELRAFSNRAVVELFLDDRSLGRHAVPPYGHVSWTVPYAPGVLEARAYDSLTAPEDAVRAHVRIATTGPACRLHLAPAADTLLADGADAVAITVSALDAAGIPVPDADHLIEFTLTGPARLIGSGNGCPWDHGAPHSPARRLHAGLAQIILGQAGHSGEVELLATSAGLAPARLRLRVGAPPAPRPRIDALMRDTAAAESRPANIDLILA